MPHTFIELNEQGQIKQIKGHFKAKNIKKYFKELRSYLNGNGSRKTIIERD